MKLALIAASLFILIKLPMCFVTNNPEELRDFEHFARTASGEASYKDYVFIYGPLSPIIYGTILKIVPKKLISVRLITLVLWGVTAGFLAALISLYLSGIGTCLLGTVFVTGIVGYPSYSHNHILAVLAVVVSTYYLLVFFENQKNIYLFYSWIGIVLAFLTRPILTGYAAGMVWFLVVFFQRPTFFRLKFLALLAFLMGTVFTAFWVNSGSAMLGSYFPQPWAVIPSKGYPNLHYLLPHLSKNVITEGVDIFIKQIWAALETAIFYLHFFIWPTFVFTLWYFHPKKPVVRAAAICCVFGLASSLDLLHYGFTDPLQEQAMWVRGQYFFSLTALSIFLMVTSKLRSTDRSNSRLLVRTVSVAILIVIGAWSYLPYVLGIKHLATFTFNQAQLPALDWILTHRDRKYVFDAVKFINEQCNDRDSVVVPQYDPGLGMLLTCHEVFGKDAYIFTRDPGYVLLAGENPYVKEGSITNGELIKNRIQQQNPRFYLIQGNPEIAKICSSPGWMEHRFGDGPNGRRVCYRE